MNEQEIRFKAIELALTIHGGNQPRQWIHALADDIVAYVKDELPEPRTEDEFKPILMTDTKLSAADIQMLNDALDRDPDWTAIAQLKRLFKRGGNQ